MIRIRCFGGISVEGTDGRVVQFRSRKHVALLSFLAANRDRVHGRDELVRLLWDSPLSSARHSLSQALYDLKRRLGEFSTQRFGDGLRLALDDGFAMLRMSGTEPVLRVYAEAPDPRELERRLAAAAALVDVAGADG